MNEVSIQTTRIRLVQGDITEQSVDAVVNAANSSLMGGGGVDGAIHRKGGPAILEDCKEIRNAQGSLPTGEAVLTTAGNLPARKVIHTVGPVWNGGENGESEKLRNAYVNSLDIAAENELRSVAFPSISTGAYRFPANEASKIALTALVSACQERPEAFDELRMVLFSPEDFEVYRSALEDVMTS